MGIRKLFFAVRPDANAGALADGARRRLMAAHRLSGSVVKASRLHVTLHWLGDHDDVVPPDLLRSARVAGSRVRMAPFRVGFDRVAGFGEDRGGLMLGGGAELRPLRQLQLEVATAMDAANIGRYIRRSFRPHVTLLYGNRPAPSEPIAPIRWEVTELVLIESVVGEHLHIEQDRWPLTSPQLGFDSW